MGYEIGNAEGDYPTLLKCDRCKAYFEIDEETFNNCPYCGYRGGDVVSSTYDAQEWRGEYPTFD